VLVAAGQFSPQWLDAGTTAPVGAR
jgi:hypothetical protein